MQRYAAWKAADIRKALREGRTPTPGAPGDDLTAGASGTQRCIPHDCLAQLRNHVSSLHVWHVSVPVVHPAICFLNKLAMQQCTDRPHAPTHSFQPSGLALLAVLFSACTRLYDHIVSVRAELASTQQLSSYVCRGRGHVKRCSPVSKRV